MKTWNVSLKEDPERGGWQVEANDEQDACRLGALACGEELEIEIAADEMTAERIDNYRLANCSYPMKMNDPRFIEEMRDSGRH